MSKKEFSVEIFFLNKHNTKNNTFKPHSHNCYEIISFLKGYGKIIMGEREYFVEPHTYCIIPPERKHVECLDGYGEIVFIGFEFKGDGYNLKEGVFYNKHDKLALFQNVFEEYKNQYLGFETAANANLKLILLDALRNDITSDKSCKDLNYIKTYIEQHFDQKIDFNSLALLSGYSYDYFRYIFRKRFGISPQQYMIDIRLENAKRLLSTTSKSCTEIAYYCGFSNSGQMSAMYKKRFGISPSAVRK